MQAHPRSLLPVVAGVAGAVCVALVSTAAHALPDASCRPCEGLVDVGPEWRVEVVAGREMHEGDGDRAAAVSVYRVADGQCCLTRTKTDYPGVSLFGVDPAHHRVYLVGHDARWAALATNGIWSYDVATGEVASVAQRIWNDVACAARPLRFAAILQSDQLVPPGQPDSARPPHGDPYAGTFRLVAFDLGAADGPASFPIATARSLGAFDMGFDPEQFAKTFQWSRDCTVLTYALAPNAATKSFRARTWRAK